jgi:hypothetical protein
MVPSAGELAMVFGTSGSIGVWAPENIPIVSVVIVSLLIVSLNAPFSHYLLKIWTQEPYLNFGFHNVMWKRAE